MKYYIVNDKNEVEEIELSVLDDLVKRGKMSPKTPIYTEGGSEWIPYYEYDFKRVDPSYYASNPADLVVANQKKDSENESKTTDPKIILFAVTIIIVFVIIAGNIGESSQESSSSGVSSFNPVYLVSIISAVAFITFVWLMFSFRSLLTEIRDLLKAKTESK